MLQIRLETPGSFPARKTAALPFIMAPHVQLQVRIQIEPLAALPANPIPQIHVRQAVRAEQALRHEPLPAVVARIPPHPRVQGPVILQVVLRLELLEAHIAGVQAQILVRVLQVDPELLGPGEGLLADHADVVADPEVDLDVRFQVVASGEAFITELAGVVALVRVDALVLLEVAVEAEHLLADLAAVFAPLALAPLEVGAWGCGIGVSVYALGVFVFDLDVYVFRVVVDDDYVAVPFDDVDVVATFYFQDAVRQVHFFWEGSGNGN